MEEKEYGFFDYFNSFQQWLEEDSPTDKAARLYMRLFCMMNRRGWQGRLGVDTQMLMSLLHTNSSNTVHRTRDALVRDGMIEYRKGSKGKPSLYRLLVRGAKAIERSDGILNGIENGTLNGTLNGNGVPNGTENGIPNGIESGTLTEKEREKRKKEAKKEIKREKEISLKTKTKDKDIIIPPQSPQRVDDDDDDERREQEKRFETFWARYPRKTHMAGARDAWNQLKPDAALFEQILQAVERGRSSQKWNEQDGRFIPGPDRWLTEKRWYDEPTSQPTAQSTTEISKEAAEWLKDEL